MTAILQRDLIAEYLIEEDKENANKFESYTKLRGFVADSFIKKWALEHIYTEDIANAHIEGFMHIHDLSDALVPYSYYGKTTVLVRGEDKQPFFISLEDIQGKKNLEVFMQGWKWTKIIGTIKHDSHTDLLKIETDNGRILIVTKDHPMFTGYKKDTVSAETLKIGDKLCSAGFFKRFSFGKLVLPPKIAWLLGMYIAEGSKHGKNYTICQYESLQRNKIIDVLNQFEIEYTISGKDIFIDGDNIIIQIVFSLIKKGAYHKSIPSLSFSKQTFFDIVSGIIDGDGWKAEQGNYATQFGIDSTSYELIAQIKTLFDIIKLPASFRSYDSTYKLKFHLTSEYRNLFKECIKIYKNEIIYRTKKGFNIDYFNTQPKIKKISVIPWVGKPVYDISTESEIFSTIGLKVHNCKGHDATKILVKGLITPTIVAAPPKHLSSFFDQLVNLIATAQQSWAGAQAVANLNTLAAPFVRIYYRELRDMGIPKELARELTFKYTKQCAQSFVYNLNFPSRAGSQTPFSNITFNFACPSNMRDEPVLNRGCEGTWGDYEEEAFMIIEAFNEVFFEGDNRNRPFTFPIVTINIIPETPFDHPLWNKLMETEIKFGTYSFFNYIGSGIDPDMILSMCCRLTIDLSQLAPTGGRWAYAGETGSIGVVTLNMARIGYIANGDEVQFYKELDRLLELAKRSLLLKSHFINLHKDRFMPLDKIYGTDLTRFFRTIGVCGLHEMSMNMNGKPLSEDQEFVSDVLNYIREWTRESQKATGVLWNLEMTPAEGTATRFANIDYDMFGKDIIMQGNGVGKYYTSMITPPNQDLSIFERIDAEQDLLSMFTGGTVHRIYIGEHKPSPEAMGQLVESLAKNTKVTYFDIASTFAVCSDCDEYHRGDDITCLSCGGEMIIWDRIVGYYRPRKQANSGKVQEIRDRLWQTIPI